MTLEQGNSQFTSEDLEVPASEPNDLEGSETRKDRLANLIRGSRRYLPGLIFVVGLLLGWLVVGWWLWPVQWTNTAPWRLHPEYQKTYIGLVAENFWWTKDIHHARDALAGWDGEAVAELLATMEREASSPEERQQLASLAEALGRPIPEESLWASLLNQKTIFLSVILSALPLVAAIALGVFSFVQNRTQPVEELLVGEGQLEEALEEAALKEQEEEQQAEKKKRRRRRRRQKKNTMKRKRRRKKNRGYRTLLLLCSTRMRRSFQSSKLSAKNYRMLIYRIYWNIPGSWWISSIGAMLYTPDEREPSQT